MTAVHENVTTLTRRTVLRTLEVEPGLFVFKREVSTQRIDSQGDLRVAPEPTNATVTQGFIAKGELAKMRQGESCKLRDDLSLVLPEGREIMRTRGYVYTLSNEIATRFNDELVRRDCYDAFERGDVTVDDVIRFEHASHMLFDRHGQVLPVAIRFDYIEAHVNNSRYDLEKAAKILLARDDITIFPVKRYRDEPDYDGVAKTVEEAVASIPYYNAERGRNRTITFRWTPRVEDYRKMWAECLRLGGRYPSTNRYHAVFNLDLLGLRAGGAALCDDFYQDVRSEQDEEA